MAAFRILTICTGNICRSPLAQLLLEQGLDGIPVEIRSAGIQALVEHPMPAPQLAIAQQLGLKTAADHAGRQLAPDDLHNVDLVLGMAREHRSAAVQLNPNILRRAFTLREFARISDVVPASQLHAPSAQTPADKLRHAVERAASYRGIPIPPDAPEDDDILDPYQRSEQTYQTSRDQIVAAVETVIAYFEGALR
ncbi:arsenate reductase/protein-tyrosine-phosphatase family protein [Enteractinococcus coprophilus]|uniref:Protein-tyrosine phosphatase n=1 Tax=Enteractinococcus coprophilus TaxID=1027633 RepID=A0A543AMM6_9MICC|nr:low molecular weight phosphatase family protein [Enteractinococcus coprophilus]TQL73842.1 protein-tyrosine phosphatase [Enteractinococcus coprophilus]